MMLQAKSGTGSPIPQERALSGLTSQDTDNRVSRHNDRAALVAPGLCRVMKCSLLTIQCCHGVQITATQRLGNAGMGNLPLVHVQPIAQMGILT